MHYTLWPNAEDRECRGEILFRISPTCFTFQNILIRVRFLNGRSVQEEFYSSYSLDYEKRREIKKSNSKKETGFDVVVTDAGPRLTIATEEFDKMMKKELAAGSF